MEADFVVRQGDTASALTDQLLDAAGVAVNLTGATVTLTLVPLAGDTALVNNGAATIPTPLEGRVSRAWGAGETATPGLYLGSWRVTFSNGSIQTFPNSGFFLVEISASAPTGLGGAYMTLEDAKQTLSLTGLSYADRDLQRTLVAASRIVDGLTGHRFYLSPAPPAAANEQRLYTPGLNRSVLRIDGLTTLTSLEVQDSSGAWATWVLGTDYVLEPASAPSEGKPYTRVRINPNRSSFVVDWPAAFYGRLQSVRVTGRWGWPTLPSGVVLATQLIANMLLRRVREAPFGIVGIGVEGNAVRLARYDAQVQLLLADVTHRKGLVLA